MTSRKSFAGLPVLVVAMRRHRLGKRLLRPGTERSTSRQSYRMTNCCAECPMDARTSEVPSRVPNVKHALTVNDHDPALAAVAIPE